MAVTIKVNGTNLTLVHQGSGGIVKSTLPDVCKTPSPGGPIPVPYPVIISLSSDLKDGTKTVKVDGGNSAAIKGSSLSRCTGDEPGTLGGVVSSTQLKEATWISYSFDVKMDGQNACRLSDKLLMNHGNTACMAGIVQPALLVEFPDCAFELEFLCNEMCKIKDEPGRKQDKIARKLWAMDDISGGNSTMKAEVPFNPNDGTPYMSQNNPRRATRNFYIPGHRRPDVIITDGSPPELENIRCVVEMKFKGDSSNAAEARARIEAYQDIFGRDNVAILEEGRTCICEDDDKNRRPAPEPVPVPAPQVNWGLVGLGALLAVGAVALALCPLDGPFGEAAAGSAAAAAFTAAFAAS